MKVLMFGWEFPPHISGGLGTACHGLTKGLAKLGVEVLFVMPKATGDEDNSIGKIINASDIATTGGTPPLDEFWSKVSFLQVNSALIPYVGLEDYYRLKEENFSSHLGGEFTSRKFNFSGKYGKNLMEEVVQYALVAAQIAKDYDFDVIHAHDWLTYLAGITAKKISGKPLTIHVHATEYDRSGKTKNDVVLNMERMGMEAADCVMAVSNLTRNIVINNYGIDASKVFTVHNAVDFHGRKNIDVERSIEDKIVTFLGRITYQKGPEYFVEAAYKVLKDYPNVRFVMAGSGDMMLKMVKRVAKLGIGSRFYFTGFLTGDDVNKMYAHSDIYVMPSVSEPFGISPLEAMKTGVPVIISKQSGVSEVVSNAIKVDFWDVDALADAMYGLLKYPALSENLSKKGVEEVDTFSWDNTAELVKTLYKKVIDKEI